MLDRQKVIKEIKAKITYAEMTDQIYSNAVRVRLLKDILELLKEQEPVEPEECDIPGELRCGACGSSVMRETGYRFRHCPWCGRKVKWDDYSKND